MFSKPHQKVYQTKEKLKIRIKGSFQNQGIDNIDIYFHPRRIMFLLNLG